VLKNNTLIVGIFIYFKDFINSIKKGIKMVVTINKKLNERRHFLFKAKAHKNISQEQFDKEMTELDKQVRINLQNELTSLNEKLHDQVLVAKKEISDGNLKRAAARIMIRYLESYFTEDEIKGIFRQGYKLMRQRL